MKPYDSADGWMKSFRMPHGSSIKRFSTRCAYNCMSPVLRLNKSLTSRQHDIDYVAHDEDPYASGGYDDVYAYVKSQGTRLFIYSWSASDVVLISC